jgi:hypothetical protein
VGRFDQTTDHALCRFAQIVGEFHGFDEIVDDAWFDQAMRVFRKLNKQFGLVHIHGNNCASQTFGSPIAICSRPWNSTRITSLPCQVIDRERPMGERPMGLARAAVCVVFCAGVALAQTLPDDRSPNGSPQSEGRSTSPETKGQLQPQGRTGPVDARNAQKGAPAESPQGETPPGTEAAPAGSSKTTVEPKQ